MPFLLTAKIAWYLHFDMGVKTAIPSHSGQHNREEGYSQPSTTNQQGFPIKIIHIDNYKMMQLAATQSTGAVQSFVLNSTNEAALTQSNNCNRACLIIDDQMSMFRFIA